MPQQLQLVIFVLAMTALVVCGCIFTRRPRKKLPETLRQPAVPVERQPAVSPSKKKRAIIGRAAKYRTLKKLGRRCDRLLTRAEARRIAANIAKLPELLRPQADSDTAEG